MVHMVTRFTQQCPLKKAFFKIYHYDYDYAFVVVVANKTTIFYQQKCMYFKKNLQSQAPFDL